MNKKERSSLPPPPQPSSPPPPPRPSYPPPIFYYFLDGATGVSQLTSWSEWGDEVTGAQWTRWSDWCPVNKMKRLVPNEQDAVTGDWCPVNKMERLRLTQWTRWSDYGWSSEQYRVTKVDPVNKMERLRLTQKGDNQLPPLNLRVT